MWLIHAFKLLPVSSLVMVRKRLLRSAEETERRINIYITPNFPRTRAENAGLVPRHGWKALITDPRWQDDVPCCQKALVCSSLLECWGQIQQILKKKKRKRAKRCTGYLQFPTSTCTKVRDGVMHSNHSSEGIPLCTQNCDYKPRPQSESVLSANSSMTIRQVWKALNRCFTRVFSRPLQKADIVHADMS